MIRLSPDCTNASIGGSCGYCGGCGRGFRYVNRLDGQPILYVVAPSVNDYEGIKEMCQANALLTDLAPQYVYTPPTEVST